MPWRAEGAAEARGAEDRGEQAVACSANQHSRAGERGDDGLS